MLFSYPQCIAENATAPTSAAFSRKSSSIFFFPTKKKKDDQIRIKLTLYLSPQKIKGVGQCNFLQPTSVLYSQALHAALGSHAIREQSFQHQIALSILDGQGSSSSTGSALIASPRKHQRRRIPRLQRDRFSTIRSICQSCTKLLR